jgi:hypothetical protein
MTAERRLAKVEATLGPKELVLRWLAEAHAYDDFTEYTRAMYAVGPESMPLDRLVHETIAWVESSSQGRSRDDRGEERQRALRQVLFLFHLILRTIVFAQEALDREGLIWTLLSAHLGLAAIDTEDGKRTAVPTHAWRLNEVRTSAISRVSEWRAMELARTRVEATYFEGRSLLFPATVRACAEQLERTERLAVMAERLAELDGLEPSPPDDPDAFAARVEQLVADHVEPARLKAFDEMGEGQRAMSVAMRWLGPKLG